MRIGTGEIRADDAPVRTLVRAPEHVLSTEIDDVRLVGVRHHRIEPVVAVLHRGGTLAVIGDGPGGDVLHLPGAFVEAGDVAAQAPHIDDVGIAAVREHIAALVTARGVPVAEGELAVVAGALLLHRAAVLLTAVDVIGEAVVGGHVVELPGGLVVPGRPALAAVDAHARTLVARHHHMGVVVRIDPYEVIVVAAGRALEPTEGLAAVRGLGHRAVRDVEGIRVLGIHRHAVEVAAHELVMAHGLPVGAAVIGAIERRLLVVAALDERIDTLVVGAGGDREADASQVTAGQTAAGELRPGLAAVRGFPDAAAGTLLRDVIGEPGPLTALPGGGEHHVR